MGRSSCVRTPRCQGTFMFCVALVLLVGCDNSVRPAEDAEDAERTEVITIGPYTQTCQGFIEQECFLIYNEEVQKWELFYESIEGFDFEVGFIYTLKVRLVDRGTEIQDVGRYAYHLVEVLSKEEVSPENFDERDAP